jgi:hypothetical protein
MARREAGKRASGLVIRVRVLVQKQSHCFEHGVFCELIRYPRSEMDICRFELMYIFRDARYCVYIGSKM